MRYAARAYEGGLVLTDPVILSRSAGRYGPTDLGTAGILTFFSQHVCNDFCSARWTKPKDARAVLPVVDGTSMTAATPPRKRRLWRRRLLLLLRSHRCMPRFTRWLRDPVVCA